MESFLWSQCCCCGSGRQQHGSSSLPSAAVSPPPALLMMSCLHSICTACLHRQALGATATRCLATAVVEGRDKRAAAVASSLRCPWCGDMVHVRLSEQPMPASRASDADASPTQNRQSTSHTVSNRALCRACADAQRAADHWCAQCNDHLCDKCLPLHRRFASAHTVVSLSLVRPSSRADATGSASAPPPVVLCPSHGVADTAPPAQLFCPRCCRAACRACAERCVDGGHRPLDIGDEQAHRAAVASAAYALRSSASRAGAALAALRHRNLDGCGVKSDGRPLQWRAMIDSRHRVLSIFEAARSRARRSLLTFYEAAARRQSAAATAYVGDEWLCAAASHALNYARLLLHNETLDVGALFQQKSLLFERMRSLGVDIERCLTISTMQSPMAMRGAHSGGGAGARIGAIVPATGRLQLDRNLRRVIASCIGRPVERSQGTQNHQVSATLNQVTSAVSVLALRLDAVHTSRVKLPGDCSDMSVTSNGTILLAAGKEGMLEYNMQGKKLSAWKPSPSSDLGDIVVSVESLDDGRVAAGVLWSHSVAIVCRRREQGQVQGDRVVGEWRLVQRIALRALPRHVCSYGHLLGVAGSRSTRQGYEVDVIRLRDGRAIISKTLDYAVLVIGVTARAVILAVDEKWSGGGGGNGKAVLAFSYTWHKLWEITTSESVMEIWPQPYGHVIAVGLSIANELLLIDGGNGKCMGSLLAIHSPPGRQEGIEGVSVAYNARRAELLAMPWDGCTVTVHQAMGLS